VTTCDPQGEKPVGDGEEKLSVEEGKEVVFTYDIVYKVLRAGTALLLGALQDWGYCGAVATVGSPVPLRQGTTLRQGAVHH
jgi:hypothetical protein